MPSEFLSICIPTRNRSYYLREMLTSFAGQIAELQLPLTTLKLYVSDNASTDDTPEVVKSFAARLPHLVYSRNAENIGADRNVIQCTRLARGEFVWVAGDDDIIEPGALGKILEALKEPGLALMVNLDTGYNARLKRPARFESFRDYAAECARSNPHILIQHTLVTSNIFRADCFDADYAETMLHTNYSHMYAMVKPVIEKGGAVLLPEFPAVTIRKRRAAAVDGVWPTNLEKSWHEYLHWLREKLQLPELDPDAVLEFVRGDLLRRIRANPFKFVWNNLPALKQPQAYAWFLKRLLRKTRG